MIMITKDNQQLLLKHLDTSDLEKLQQYMQRLSAETKKRFDPHAYDLSSLMSFYNNRQHHGFVAINEAAHNIVAYAVVKGGYLEHDRQRLESYGLVLNHQTDCTFAPSVADAWQGHGIGKSLFNFILPWAKEKGFKRIILWGGVQASNYHAVNYYNKLGFRNLGSFEYYGLNNDMLFEII